MEKGPIGLDLSSTLMYPVSLLIGGWDWWSVQRANGKYKDHLVGQLTRILKQLLWKMTNYSEQSASTYTDMQTFSWPVLTWIMSNRNIKLIWVDRTQKLFPECPPSKVQLIWDLGVDVHVSVCQWHGNKRRPAFNCRVNMNNEHLGPGIHLAGLWRRPWPMGIFLRPGRGMHSQHS